MISKDISFKELNYEHLMDKAIINKELTTKLIKVFREVNDSIYQVIEDHAFEGTEIEPDYIETNDRGYDYFQTLLSNSATVYNIVMDLARHRNRSTVTKEQLIEEKKDFDTNCRYIVHESANKIAEVLSSND